VLTSLLADVGCTPPRARSPRRPGRAKEEGTVQRDGEIWERAVESTRLQRLVERPVPKVIEEISPLDRQYQESPKQYLQWGQRAVRCLKMAMLAGGRDDARSILDLPSGHGRSLRAIRAAFPDARITAWDLDRDAVDFCARVFGAIPVYGDPDPAANALGEAFDLIWCGSFLSHVDAGQWHGFLRLLSGRLSPRGLLVLTTRGRRVARLMGNAKRRFGLTSEEVQTLLETYERDGFAHSEGGSAGAEGVSIASPAWVCSQLARLYDIRLVGFTEGGYGDEDVIACIREPLGSGATAGSPAKWSRRVTTRIP
jgi:SAM-dependent methyltransferase